MLETGEVGDSLPFRRKNGEFLQIRCMDRSLRKPDGSPDSRLKGWIGEPNGGIPIWAEEVARPYEEKDPNRERLQTQGPFSPEPCAPDEPGTSPGSLLRWMMLQGIGIAQNRPGTASRGSMVAAHRLGASPRWGVLPGRSPCKVRPQAVFCILKRPSSCRIRVELSPQLFAVLADGHFVRLNDEWSKTLDWDLVELMARPVMSFLQEDDREQAERGPR